MAGNTFTINFDTGIEKVEYSGTFDVFPMGEVTSSGQTISDVDLYVRPIFKQGYELDNTNVFPSGATGIYVCRKDTGAVITNVTFTSKQSSGGGKVAHTLTITGWSSYNSYNLPSVNGTDKIDSDSPITLKNGDVIKVPTDRASVTINGTSYTSQTTTLDLDNQDIALAASGPEKTLEVYNCVTINYSEPVDYIISETDLTTIADSIRTKTSSSNKLTLSAMAEKIKTIPVVTDVSDAATLTAKLTEANIGNFYRYTGTATSDYATGAIYQVTQA